MTVLGLLLLPLAAHALTVPAGYDRTLRPSLAAGGSSCADPEQVEVQFYVSKLSTLDPHTSTFQAEGYLRLWWTDHRLAFNNDTCRPAISTPDLHMDEIWYPDLYWETATEESLGEDDAGRVLRIDGAGGVMMSRRARVKLRCPFHFGALPYDVHECPIVIGLYSTTVEDANLVWRGGDQALPGLDGCPRRDDPTQSTSEPGGACRVSDWKASVTCTYNRAESYSTGDYAFVFTTIRFERFDARTFQYYYMMAIFFCVMSYCGFWIDLEATPARVALGMLTVVGVSASLASAMSRIPATTYSVWLVDVLLGCVYFNVAAFVAQTLANVGLIHYRRTLKIDRYRRSASRRDEERSVITDRPQKQQGSAASIEAESWSCSGELDGSASATVPATPPATIAPAILASDSRFRPQRPESPEFEGLDINGNGKADLRCLTLSERNMRIASLLKELDMVMRVVYLVGFIVFLVVIHAQRDSYGASYQCQSPP